MASSAFRRVGLSRCASGIFISRRCCIFCGTSSQNGAAGCWNFAARILQFGHRMISTTGLDESPPWLMLPPTFEGDGMFYNFYSLAQKKVLKHPKSSRGGGEESESPDDDAEFVGSSHGWLSLFNRRNNDLFLSNPLTGRHIKLPPIDFLDDRKMNLRNGHGSVSKMIISSSPDVEGCRVMMTFGPANRLAFCSPGHDSVWNHIGKLFSDHMLHNPPHFCARVYEDLVYCNWLTVLTCMTSLELDLKSLGYSDSNIWSEIEDWDIEKPIEDVRDLFPEYTVKLFDAKRRKMGKNTHSWLKENMGFLGERCIQIPHLVYAQQYDQLYLVMRFVEVMAPDGRPLDRVPLCPIIGLRGYYPCKTFGFIVFKVGLDGCYEVLDDFNGLAIFVGINQSFVISVADSDSGELKPNSIYFTNAKRIRMLYGSDTGIFDYESKTISPIIDPDDDASQRIERDESLATSQRIESSALWFSS